MARATTVCKLILVGNGSVGKTSIISRFVDDGFQRVYKQTVGLDFFEKNIELARRSIALQVWDIGGQQISSRMLPKYIYGSNAIFLCYDVTDPQSFEDVDDWFGLVKRTFAAAGKRLPCVYLVGNKIDLMHLRKVTERRHDRYVEENKLDGGHLISAQSGEAVRTAFYLVAAEVAGVSMSAAELEQTKRILGVSVVREDDDEDLSPEARRIMEEDMALEAAKKAREEKEGCKCIIL